MAEGVDFQAPPWWLNSSGDYTKCRTGKLNYNTMDALIGRKDTNKFILTTNDPATVSGVPGALLE